MLLPQDIAESAQKRTTASHKTVKKAPAKKKPVAAKRDAPAARGMDQDWQKTVALVQNQQDPVARKLLTWIYVTGTKMPIDSKQLIAFKTANPNWPKMGDFREKIEQNIAASLPPADVAAWFVQNPAVTFSGIRAHVDALIRQNQPAQAQAALSSFWKDADLNKNQTATLAGAYKASFAAGDHTSRLDNLIWENRYGEAEYMLAFVDADTRAVAQARIALGKMSKNAPQLAEAVPAARQNDEGLLYERLRWRRRHNMDDGALEIIRQMPTVTTQPELWWGEMNVMARRAMEKHNYAQAYQIAQKHTMTTGIQYSQAEWLLGWLELRRLKAPTNAYKRFDNLYRHVGTAISKSRAAYWAARAAEAVPDHTLAAQWDKVSAQFTSTFYGQLSYQKLYGAPALDAFKDPAIDPAVVASFNQHELVRAVRLLHSVKLDQLIDPFLAKLDALAQSKTDYILTGRLALEAGRYYYTVEANKDLQQKLGLFMFEEGYPTLPPLPAQTPEKALVHAIIHRESMFNPLALSQAGARGLMQLMPATAKAIAKREGETYNIKRLTADPRYNVQIGSAYLRHLVDNYNGFYPMAIAAYNAGPGNVAEWVRAFGDPRQGNIDLIDWIESVPIYETRNYIQRVMESYYIYRLRFGEEPKTVMDFVKK
ncbi:MAG: lytic transglycosylase domain-containing protein [Alphaproteobacteria bacterium]